MIKEIGNPFRTLVDEELEEEELGAPLTGGKDKKVQRSGQKRKTFVQLPPKVPQPPMTNYLHHEPPLDLG